jgi:molybdate transport system ATP-binding protein
MSMRASLQLTKGSFILNGELSIESAGVTALYGPSGCGKTTLLRALAGLEPQALGRIEVDGKLWQDSEAGVFLAPHLRPIGFVFQEGRLFEHLNVEGNLRFGLNRTPKTNRRVSFGAVVEQLDLEPLLGRGTASLSGGEQRRVALGRALLRSPGLLLLDEPLSGLDAERKSAILPYLERIQQTLAVPIIYVSHSLDDIIQLADELVCMESGRLVSHGPLETQLTRLDGGLATENEASAVVDAQVALHHEEDHLTELSFSGGRLLVTRNDLATGSSVRVRVQARDISLALSRAEDTSISNILEATIVEIGSSHPHHRLIVLEVGGTRLLARVSLRSASRLQLQVGSTVYAQIKAVAIAR